MDSLAAKMKTLTITPVRTRADLREFIDLPFRLYWIDPNWVPPLRSELRHRLDPDRNPFFQHGEAELLLASRAGRVVGRISAHIDEHYNEFHSRGGAPDRTGFFGFFDIEEHPEIGVALLDRAAEWLAERGRDQMIGPASFTLNDEAGLLVEGFDSPPTILMPYNPPSYGQSFAQGGLEKAQDLYEYRLEVAAQPPPGVVEFARSAASEFTFRTVDMRHFEEEMVRFMAVYNEAWEHNWGFVPLTEAEVRGYAKMVRPIIDPNLMFFAERGGEPVGVGLTLPNVNEALIWLRRRLKPVGAIGLVRKSRKHDWRSCRIFALGVRPQFRGTGIGARLYLDTLDAARRGGYDWCEVSWILESNDEMNRAVQRMGGTRYKTYRMYRKQLG